MNYESGAKLALLGGLAVVVGCAASAGTEGVVSSEGQPVIATKCAVVDDLSTVPCDATSWPRRVDANAATFNAWLRRSLVPRVFAGGSPSGSGMAIPGGAFGEGSAVPEPAIPNCAGLSVDACRRIYEPQGNACVKEHPNSTTDDATALGGDDEGAFACGPIGEAGVCVGGEKQTQYASLGVALESALVNDAPAPTGVDGGGTVPECARPTGGIDLTSFTLLDATGASVAVPRYEARFTGTADPEWQTRVTNALASAQTIVDATGASSALTQSQHSWLTAFVTEIGARDAGLSPCAPDAKRANCYSASIAMYAAMSAWVAAQVLPSSRHLLTATYLVASKAPGACNTAVPQAVFASRVPLFASPTFVGYFDPDSTWPRSAGIPNDVAFIARASGVFAMTDACGSGASLGFAAVLATGDPSPCNCIFWYGGWTYYPYGPGGYYP
jgi:hypothetical protein